MAKSEYWLLPVRCSINKIMKVAKEYNIELIKEKGFAFGEYRGHRFAVNNDNHPFIAYLQNLNDEVVLTKRVCTDLVQIRVLSLRRRHEANPFISFTFRTRIVC